MESNFFGIAVGALSGAVVAIVTAIGGYLINSRNQKDSTDKTSNEQAFLLYKQLVETLKQNFDDVQDDYRELEKSYIEYREKFAECRKDCDYLKKELDEAIKKIEELMKIR